MQIETLPIEGLCLVLPRVFDDERGFFYESYNAKKFATLGLPTEWVQDNHARSGKNILRGLHFQRGKGQPKLIRCTIGSIWDVAVDIRPDSPTLGQWHGVELSEENRRMLFIPGGFAHGYLTLSDVTEVQYKCGTVYDPDLETEIAWDDDELAVDWPVDKPVLSKRDKQAQSFRAYLESLKNT